MTSILMYTDPDVPGTLFLGEVEAGEAQTTSPLTIHCKNVTDSQLRNVTIVVDDDNVELSMDGQSWGSTITRDGVLDPQAEFDCYSRAVSPDSTANAGTRRFQYTVRATSLGGN